MDERTYLHLTPPLSGLPVVGGRNVATVLRAVVREFTHRRPQPAASLILAPRPEGVMNAALFPVGERSIHVVGRSRIARTARTCLGSGGIDGWWLNPMPIRRTPLSALRPWLPSRILNALALHSFSTVEEVDATPEEGYLAFWNIGPQSVAAIREAITEFAVRHG